MADSEQHKLADAFKAVRVSLGFATAELGYRAQSGLSYDAYMNRESGRTEWSLLDIVRLAHDWNITPAHLISLWAESYDNSTFAPIAEKCGLPIEIARRRFDRKRAELGVSFEVLYLLIMRDQTGL